MTAGRGCGAAWDAERGEPMIACTADLQLIVLEPGAAHEYSVRVIPAVGPLRLAPGEYVVDEVVRWMPPQGGAGPAGQFTVRLTYTVD